MKTVMTLVAGVSCSRRIELRKQFFGLVLAVCGVLAVAPANAVPVYAYSKNELAAFTVSGRGVAAVVPNYFSRHYADFEGFGTDSHPRGSDDPTRNLPQSKVGQEPFPAENTFDPNGKRGGGYARADTMPVNRGGRNVAEAYRTTAGKANAEAYFDLTSFVDITADTGSELTFAFTARPFMHVMTATQGDIAAASLKVILNVDFTPKDGTKRSVFEWKPCGNALSDPLCFMILDKSLGLSINSVVDPFDLNELIICSSLPSCEKTWPADGTKRTDDFSINVNGFGVGQVKARLYSEEFVSVTAAANGTPIPEPSTLLLLFWAAVGVIMMRDPLRSRVDAVSNVKHFSGNRVDTAVEF